MALSSAARERRLWHRPSPLGRERGGSGGAGGHRRGAPCGAEGEGRDSPEALKDCSTRPTFTTCKERQVRRARQHHPSPPAPVAPRFLLTLTPTKGTNFWQESSSGLCEEERLVRGWGRRLPRWPASWLGDPRAGRGRSRLLAPLLCPPSPGTPCPRHGSTGHATQGGKESAPPVPGEGLHAGGQPCPALGPRLLCTARGTDAHGVGREGGPGSGTASTSQYLI